MTGFSRRDMLGAAATGGMVAAATGTETFGQGQPPFGPTPAPLAGSELPSFRFQLGAVAPKTWDGGWAKEATVAEFPVSQAIAGVLMSLASGGLRELHWHANAAEWAYVIKGQCRVTTINPQGQSQIVDFNAGDVWYFPRGFGHSIQGIGSEDCLFVLVFDNGYFSEFGTFSISDWVGHIPPEVLGKYFGVPAATFANFPKREVYIAKGPVPPPLTANPAPGTLDYGPLTHRYGCWRSGPTPIRAAPTGWSRNASFRSPRRLPARSCRSSPARCASRTGIPTPTNGSTTSPAARA
jgi:oxalate decarboxylase